MKLIINKPFEVDVELSDFIPKYLCIKFNLVCDQSVELENNEISHLTIKREYGNEKSKLVIQPLGVIVMEFLDKYFGDLFEYTYTSNMENDLDRIAKGEYEWFKLCQRCNEQINNF